MFIKINDIKTKVRDKNGRGGHTFIGETIKIELVIDKIKENMNDYIIFSDATIFINNTKTQELYNFFCNYLSYDLCFVDEGKDNHVNIGIILIQCSKETLLFFENVLEILIKKGKKCKDQGTVNDLISEGKHNLHIGKFDKNKIVAGYTINNNLLNNFLIYKSFIYHSNDIISNYNQRIINFKKHNLIDDDEYKLLLK